MRLLWKLLAIVGICVSSSAYGNGTQFLLFTPKLPRMQVIITPQMPTLWDLCESHTATLANAGTVVSVQECVSEAQLFHFVNGITDPAMVVLAQTLGIEGYLDYRSRHLPVGAEILLPVPVQFFLDTYAREAPEHVALQDQFAATLEMLAVAYQRIKNTEHLIALLQGANENLHGQVERLTNELACARDTSSCVKEPKPPMDDMASLP